MKRRVVAAVEDMFFAAKIRATAEHVGAEVVFPRSEAALVEAVKQGPTALVVVDLQAGRFDPVAVVEALRRDEGTSAVRVLGYCSHVETELMRRARAAGFDQILPRSAFTTRLPELLRGEIE